MISFEDIFGCLAIFIGLTILLYVT